MKRLALALAVASVLPAQTQLSRTFYISRPNCHVLSDHVENPFDYTHYYHQPALAWDAEAAALSLGSGVLLKEFHAPLWVAGALPTIGFGLIPHLVGWRMGKYQIDLAHWTFVLWNRGAPAFWAYAHRDDSGSVKWKNHARATTVWLVGEAALSCFDR